MGGGRDRCGGCKCGVLGTTIDFRKGGLNNGGGCICGLPVGGL